MSEGQRGHTVYMSEKSKSLLTHHFTKLFAVYHDKKEV
jgi:hypothetical protein